MFNADIHDLTFVGVAGALAVTLLELTAVLSAIHAIMASRTSQGAVAWAISLVTPPLMFIALPAYWVFGRSRFEGYVKARREGNTSMHGVLKDLGRTARERGLVRVDVRGVDAVLERLAWMPFTHQNRVQLLIDGQATFDAILGAIDTAQQYILVQFFIVKDDQLGRELQQRLLAKRREGVRISFMYDEVGSHKLSSIYIDTLRKAGVDIRPFHSNRRNRFQLNFRNHRKIVVVDGVIAFAGGLNVGDEYMGRSKSFGPWRDTHAQIEGPAVLAVQLSFLEDWYWATHEVPKLNWSPAAAAGGEQDVLILPTGPADSLETCGLFFIQMISMAQDRLWIASPYFVPDIHVIAALQLAALRGVDVRIMLPEKPDHLLVYLASFSYLQEMEEVGVKIYRYEPGFLHQKAMLIDDRWAAIGTANLDNRSFRLNFEITVLVEDTAFVAEAAQMFENDFAHCRIVESDDLEERSLWFKIGVRIARLMSPIL
ncbi:MAG: cardiolipin synthase [Planctomycetaceae bacterium]|nr:cardiolipin synthase [Planctomycetaceae bacterium]